MANPHSHIRRHPSRHAVDRLLDPGVLIGLGIVIFAVQLFSGRAFGVFALTTLAIALAYAFQALRHSPDRGIRHALLAGLLTGLVLFACLALR